MIREAGLDCDRELLLELEERLRSPMDMEGLDDLADRGCVEQ